MHWRSKSDPSRPLSVTFPPSSLQKRWRSPEVNPITKQLVSRLAQHTAVAAPLKGLSATNNFSPEATDQTTTFASSPSHLSAKRKHKMRLRVRWGLHWYLSNNYTPGWQQGDWLAPYGIEEYSEDWTLQFLNLKSLWAWYCSLSEGKTQTYLWDRLLFFIALPLYA